MGAAAAALPIALQVAGTLFEATSQASAAKAGAKVDFENARQTELQGAFEGADIRRRARATQGEAISALADNGVVTGEGSAADLLFQNALEAEYAVMSARYSAATEARGFRMQAAEKKRAARSAIIGGVLRAGAQIVTGAMGAQNAKAEDAARQRRDNAYYPGGQQFPTPVPIHGANPYAPYGAGR